MDHIVFSIQSRQFVRTSIPGFWLLLMVAGLGGGGPVMAADDQLQWADRYRTLDGHVTLLLESSEPGAESGRLLGQFVNRTPGERWVGELELEPVEPGRWSGRFWDASPGSKPLVVCTGAVDVQQLAASPAASPAAGRLPAAERRLAMTFKITGGENCQGSMGDAYTMDFVPLPPVPRSGVQSGAKD
jgi:hypothetical protein